MQIMATSLTKLRSTASLLQENLEIGTFLSVSTSTISQHRSSLSPLKNVCFMPYFFIHHTANSDDNTTALIAGCVAVAAVLVICAVVRILLF